MEMRVSELRDVASTLKSQLDNEMQERKLHEQQTQLRLLVNYW